MEQSEPIPTGQPWGPEATPYEALGGDTEVRRLTELFYDQIDASAPTLRAMLPKNDSVSREKLYEFLSGWMGGPPLYTDKYGTVCMTTPHEPYHIGPEERDQWLMCMDKALEQIDASDELVEMLKIPMFRIADAVRNKEGPSAARIDPNVIAAG